MAHIIHPSLNSNKTLWESPVPLLIDIVEPVTVKDEVKELEARDKNKYKIEGFRGIN